MAISFRVTGIKYYFGISRVRTTRTFNQLVKLLEQYLADSLKITDYSAVTLGGETTKSVLSSS